MLDYIINEFTAYGGLRNIIFFTVVLIVLYLGWLSTNSEPLHYRIWVAQLFSSSSHRMLQLYNHGLNESSHQLFRAPGDFNWSPFVTTLIIVKKPNSILSRNVQSNFFRHLQTNPIEEFENREFTNFIIQHVHEIDPTENNEQQVMPGQPQVSRSQTLAFDLLSRRRNNYLRRQRRSHDRWLQYYGDTELIARLEMRMDDDEDQEGEEDSQSNDDGMAISVTPGTNSGSTSNGTINRVDVEEQQHLDQTLTTEDVKNDTANITIEVKFCAESRFIETKLSTPLDQFKKQCSPENNGNIKLYFKSMLLEHENKSLGEYGLYDKCVVNGELIPTGEIMSVRLKHLDDSIVNAVIPTTHTVGDLKRSHYAESVESDHVIRFIFQGQLLRNDARTLQSYGITEDSVIHVHIGQTAYRQEGVQTRQRQDNLTQQPNVENIQRYAPHPITGFQWIDTTLYTLLSCILWLGHWAESEDIRDQDESIISRILHGIRSFLRPIVGFLTHAYMQIQNQDRDPELVHNFGVHLPVVICVKVMFLVLLSYFYQDATDTKTTVLLGFIILVTLIYAYAAFSQRVIRR